jgi:hypothetical protein
LYISFPLFYFILSIFVNLDNYNYKFNAYAYFTNPSIGFFIFFIICTVFLIRYFIKRKTRIVILSLLRKYSEFNEGYFYFLIDKYEKEYTICWKIYDALEGNEVIEVLMEDDKILHLLNIIKREEKKD